MSFNSDGKYIPISKVKELASKIDADYEIENVRRVEEMRKNVTNLKHRIKLYGKLIKEKGISHQFRVFITELYELMTQVSRLINKGSVKDTIIDEFVDVFICLEQFYLYGLNEGEKNIPKFLDMIKLDDIKNDEVYMSTIIIFNKIMSNLEYFIIETKELKNTPEDKFSHLNLINRTSFVNKEIFTPLFTSLFKKILRLLELNGYYSEKSFIIHFNYKFSRLEDRFSRNKFL